MTCATCAHCKLDNVLWDREFCPVWNKHIDGDDPACRHYEPDHGEVVITQEMALAMVVGAGR